MTDSPHLATLGDLNRNYVRSVDQADVEWFDRGSTVKNLREHDVHIRLLGDFAVIHGRTSYTKPDGSSGGGWYTDDWQLRPEGWRCVSAHVSRA